MTHKDIIDTGLETRLRFIRRPSFGQSSILRALRKNTSAFATRVSFRSLQTATHQDMQQRQATIKWRKARLRALTKEKARALSDIMQTPPPATGPDGLPMLRPRIDIPVIAETPVQTAQDALHAVGRNCARQDRWDLLAGEIRNADQQRKKTPGGDADVDFLIDGALSDLFLMIAENLAQNNEPNAVSTIKTLKHGLEDRQEDPALRLLLAYANLGMAEKISKHLDTHVTPDLAQGLEQERAQLLKSAITLSDGLDPIVHDSPAQAALRCRLSPYRGASSKVLINRLVAEYEDLLDLDPTCISALSAMGSDLGPARFGSAALLADEARKTARRLCDVWGRGAYVWIYLDVIFESPDVIDHIDSVLFTSGLQDILDRHVSQHHINRLAALCHHISDLANSDNASRKAGLIAACLGSILETQLHEIHPIIWAKTKTLYDQHHVTPEKGKKQALTCIAEHFANDIGAGKRILFRPDGLIIRREL